MKKSTWKTSAVALAAILALGLPTTDAQALALGRVNVQSALGEPFRAEIEIPEINPDEVASLRASVGSAATFRAAGMELSPTIANLVITLQRRSDGRYFLRLTSDRAVNDPFLDLVLEASWSSGRLVRDYTLLFDPPNLRQGSATATAQASPVAPPGIPPPTATARLPQRAAAAPSVERRAAAAPPAERAGVTPPAAPAVSSAVQPLPGESQKVTVQFGDTAGRIAASNKPATISLDQMLVALLRANPEAFIDGNVNRLKAGAVLELPSASQAGATEPGEARRVVVAQSRDFNEFRRRLAEGAPTAAVSAADRSSAGRVQAQVEEKAANASTPDKLTLSKGAAQDRAAAETVARERAAQDAAVRVAELNKNLAELNKLSTGVPPAGASSPAAGATAPAGAAGSATPAPAATAPGVSGPGLAVPAVVPGAVPGLSTAATPAPAAAVATAPAGTPGAAATTSVAPAADAGSAASAGATAPSDAGAAAPAAAAASAPTEGAPNPTGATPPAPAVVPVASDETSLVDDLLQNPWMPAAAGGLLALLLGFGLYRVRQRKKAGQIDSSFLESRVQPDSFFGASGGQRIDTAQGGSAIGSSMVYSASQLDAAGDVDPVAEADVYLAYGRDLQAEEILREALRTNPERVAIHSKLLEIYAKRREVQAFGKAAEEAFSLTHGVGAEWEHICTLGREIDPSNALYRPGGQPGDVPGSGTALPKAAVVAAAAGAAGVAAVSPVAPAAPVPSPLSALDLDLDLDLSPSSAAQSNLNAADRLGPDSVPLTAAMPSQFGDVGAAPAKPQAPPDFTVRDLDFSIDSFDLDDDPVAVSKPVAAGAIPTGDGMIEFDLGSLSLDLDQPVPPSAASGNVAAAHPGAPPALPSGFMDAADIGDTDADPLATKLALAEEFSAIGDPDGARSLAEEVRAEASGDLKGRAERFLAELN